MDAVDGIGRAWVLGRALIHVFSTSTAQHRTAQHVCLRGRVDLDATQTAPANRLSASTSLVCWLLGMVPGCLVGTRVGGTSAWGHPRLPAALSPPCFPKSLLRCLLACLMLACGRGLFVACGPVARPTGLDSGVWMLDLDAAVNHRNTKDRIDRQAGWAEGAKLPGYKSQRLTRPPWPPPKAQTRCSSLLGVIPAATNNRLSCTRSKSARWDRWFGLVGGISGFFESPDSVCSVEPAREHETRPCLSGFVHDGWMMDYPALSGPQERNPSPSSACLTVLNPMPSSTEEPHTHTPHGLVSSSLARPEAPSTGLVESKASCQLSPAAGQPPRLITRDARDAPPCT